MRRHDAIVIGAGVNGLAAAAYLGRAGLDVLVLERAADIGGAVASGEPTIPGAVHDLYATNMNLFAGSPVFAELGGELHRHGLRFVVSDAPFASAFPDGRALRGYRDAARTRAGIAAHDAADAEGWDRLSALFERHSRLLFELYGARLPSLAAASRVVGAARRDGPRELTELARTVLGTTRSLGERFLATREARALIAPWGLHLDFGPDVALGALFPLLEVFGDIANGMAIAEGGAGRLTAALAALVRDAGGEVRVGAPVARVLVESGRASGVELASGERIAADRAIVADLVPSLLFGRLIEHGAQGQPFAARIADYRHGPATMMVHLALDGPPRWAAGDDLAGFAYVHLGPYVDDMARAYADAMAGRLPAEPLLVVGQTTAVDPGRAPEGTYLLWIQVRPLPVTITGDAVGEIAARAWPEAKHAFAERVLDKLERYAPGVRNQVRASAVLGPDDLERANPCLVGGDSIGGSHHIDQGGPLRPLGGWSGYRTPIEALWMVGAATWPGAGVHGISGRSAAMSILARERGPRRLAARLRASHRFDQ